MRFLLKIGCLFLVVGILSCGKNDPTVGTDYGYGQAPYYSNPNFPTGAQYPNFPTLNNPPPQYFNPQQTNQCGQSYCYMYQPFIQMGQQFPAMQPQFNQYWNQFVNTCWYYQVEPYSQQGFDFFYVDYMPNTWQDLYQQMQPFYNWYDQGMSLPPQVNQSYFWYYYYGMPYQNINGCSGGCGW